MKIFLKRRRFSGVSIKVLSGGFASYKFSDVILEVSEEFCGNVMGESEAERDR